MQTNFLRKLQDHAGFTRNEQKIFLFLSIVFITGAFIKIYKAYFVHQPVQQFDYSTSDAQFKERTAQNFSAHPDDKKNPGVPSPGQKIDLNSATKNMLTRLPGIGEGIAEQIILYRDERGKFSSVDELKKIRGIGPKKFEKILPYVEIR
jgi:comEA protein